MNAPARRLVVVGGGVLGTMHAVEGVRRGYEVVQIERDLMPRGASVRNFGLIWVSGRAPGTEVALALAARQRWEEIAASCPGTGFRAIGSLTVARRPEELAVLEGATRLPDADERGFSLLSASEVRRVNPVLAGNLLGGLFCARDAVVEPRLVLGALREHLVTTGAYRFLPGREVTEVRPHAVVDRTGEVHNGDLVVCCPGAHAGGFLDASLSAAPLRRVRLQMLETEPLGIDVPTALADGDSLRYYPAYAAAARTLPPQDDLAADWGAQLLLVRRLGGHLTIGDTHRYEEPFVFDIDEAPYRHLLGVAAALLGRELPPVERRWAGVYAEVTDGGIYHRAEVTPGVVVVTGAGGRGMTMSPAIAEETFR